jgi:hypothetical protein
MGRSLASHALITPDNSLPDRSQGQAKATLRREATQSELADAVKAAARTVYAKQELAAAALGKTPGNFSRDVDAGSLRLADVAALGPEMLAEVGRELTARCGSLVTPQEHQRRLIRSIRSLLDELDQVEVA